MQFQDLREKVFIECGFPDSGNDRPDYLYQKVNDAINTALDEICANCAPALQFLTREKQLTVAAGESETFIDDYCQRPLSMWTEGPFAGEIVFRRQKNVDYDGSRNSNLQPYAFGPYQCTLLPRTTTPLFSGVAGSGTGATVTEGSTSVALGSSGPLVLSTAVGRMMKFNGEDEDYIVATTDGAHAITVDRPIRSRVRGVDHTNIGAGYAAATCRWEIGPVGRFRLRFLPAPNIGFSPYVRYQAYPRRLVNASDTPELQSDMHHLIWKGALRAMAATKQNEIMYQQYTSEFANTLRDLKVSDIDEVSSPDGPRVERLEDYAPMGWVPGMYERGVGSLYSGY